MMKNYAILPASMKALVLRKDRVLEYANVPMPQKMGPDSVLVRIAYAGICSSDLKRGFGGGAYHYPLIMGHELSGLVEESFPGSLFSQGDRVVVYPLLPCRRCLACQNGAFAQCVRYDYFGSRRDGGFAEYLYVPEANLLPVPGQVELLHAALTEPCAVALHGVSRLNVRIGDSAAVIGFGPIGSLAAQWLSIRGCSPIYAVDIDRRKLALAAELGCHPVNARDTDPVAAIYELTDGRGADRVVEACGQPQTFLQAVQAAGSFGELLFLGNLQGRFTIAEKEFSAILRKELKILGSWNSRIVPREHNDWSIALRYLAGQLRVAPLITHTPPLREGPEIFKRMASGSLGSHGRVVFRVLP